MLKSMRNFVAQCFWHFKNTSWIRRWIKRWNAIFYHGPRLIKIFVCHKKDENQFFLKIYLWTPFWTIFFFTWFICMLSINHQNLVINETQYLDWSLQRLAIFKNKNKNSCVKRLVSWLSSCHDPCSIMLAWSQLVVVAKPWRCTTQQTC
jgi:hypothetical protein